MRHKFTLDYDRQNQLASYLYHPGSLTHIPKLLNFHPRILLLPYTHKLLPRKFSGDNTVTILLPANFYCNFHTYNSEYIMYHPNFPPNFSHPGQFGQVRVNIGPQVPQGHAAMTSNHRAPAFNSPQPAALAYASLQARDTQMLQHRSNQDQMVRPNHELQGTQWLVGSAHPITKFERPMQQAPQVSPSPCLSSI